MSDIPNRLPAPEKRKDKIRKNDMRYLYRVQKGEQRTKRREKIDEEIKSEKRAAEKRRRFSCGNNELKKLKLLNRNAVHAVMGEGRTAAGRKKPTDKNAMDESSLRVFWKLTSIPCVMDNRSWPCVDDESDPALTAEEIAALDNAVIWKDLDYPHIIPHPLLWVFCAHCHKGMRSTNIGMAVQTNVESKVSSKERTAAVNAPFIVPPSVRWLCLHRQCIEDFRRTRPTL